MVNDENMSIIDVVYQFDDLSQDFMKVFENPCEELFLEYFHLQEHQRLKYVETMNECKRLQSALEVAHKDISVLTTKLASAKKIFDLERMRRQQVELIRNSYAEKLNVIRRVLLVDYPNLPESVKTQLSTIDEPEIEDKKNANYLSTILELDCTPSNTNSGSIRSFQSEEELDETNTHFQNYKKHSILGEVQPVAIKRKRSYPIEDVNYNDVNKSAVSLDKFKDRKHTFVSRNVIMPERCIFCEKRLCFGVVAYKCSECNATCHAECRRKIPLPCVAMGTPTKRGTRSAISDLAPSTFPRIPALVVHCINKIEQLGLNEIGLYRIPGNDKDIRTLKEKFLKCKGVPSLEGIDIHTICCCLKDFLRNLDDPLIPNKERGNFLQTVTDHDAEKLQKLISSLPEANRHTLAYVILHLQRVAKNIDSKMPVHNLATVFGPTLVGYSEAEPTNPVIEAQTAISVVTELLELSSNFWNGLLNSDFDSLDMDSDVPKTPNLKDLKKPRKLLNCRNTRFFDSPSNRI